MVNATVHLFVSVETDDGVGSEHAIKVTVRNRPGVRRPEVRLTQLNGSMPDAVWCAVRESVDDAMLRSLTDERGGDPPY